MFLITGCGRSGTKYIAAALSKCGLSVGHERLGEDGIVSAAYCFDVEEYPCGEHEVPRQKFDIVLHQVRQPLDTIASLKTGHRQWWSNQFLPEIARDERQTLRRRAYMWLIFNEEAERQAAMTYRIEDLEEVWPHLQQLLGFDAPYSTIATVSKRTNSRKHNQVTWPQIRRAVPEIYNQLIEAAKRFGY